MTVKMTKGQFKNVMRAYHATVAPRQKYQLAYVGDYSGNITVSGDPTLMWAHQGDNLFRVSNTMLSGSVPAGTPIWVGKSVGVDSKYMEVKRVAYEQQAAPTTTVYNGAYLTANQFGFGDSNNNLSSSPVFTLSGPQFVITYQGSGASFVGKTYRNGSVVNPFYYGQCANGTQASPTASVLNDILNRLSGEGYGVSFTNASTGAVDIVADETFNATNKGTRIDFSVTPHGSVTKAVAVSVLTDGRLNSKKGVKVAYTPVADAAYAQVITDEVIAYTSLTAGRIVTLLASATVGAGGLLTVKDESGNAGTFNITLTPNGAEKIDGAATKVINAGYGSLRLYNNGSNWFII